MKRIGYILLALVLVGCNQNVLVSHYETLPNQEWVADSVVSFSFDVTDTLAHYEMVINVRHADDFPYQNIWLFTRLYSDSLCLASDTLNYYLADLRGQWLGNGFGRLRDMPMLYKQNVRFAASGNYRIEVQHAMREDVLKGVNDVGLTITKE